MNNENQKSLKVEIYSHRLCPYCSRAKALLDAEGVGYETYEISTDSALMQEMHKRSGRLTVPQIFINDHHIGGSDDLAEAQKSGLLNELLGFQIAVSA